jgi:hypothetical protein
MWNYATEQLVALETVSESRVTCMAFHPAVRRGVAGREGCSANSALAQGRVLAVGAGDGSVALLSPTTLSLLQTLWPGWSHTDKSTAAGAAVTHVSFSASGAFLGRTHTRLGALLTRLLRSRRRRGPLRGALLCGGGRRMAADRPQPRSQGQDRQSVVHASWRAACVRCALAFRPRDGR